MSDRREHIAALSLPLDQLPDPLPIPTIEKPFDVTIRPPGSKSITNRALLLAALADGTSELRGPLIDADDAQVMLRAIQQLGAKVEVVRGSRATGGSPASAIANPGTQTRADEPPVAPEPLDILRITGVNGRWKIPPGQTITINLNNAGTATRFLTAAAILAPPESGGIIIDGDARMRERPIGELVDALRSINVSVEYIGGDGFPPVKVQPLRSLGSIPASVRFGQTTSSQFISAMLLIAPHLPKGLRVVMPLEPTSLPYISMSVGLMTLLGLERASSDYCTYSKGEDSRTEIAIRPHQFRGCDFDIEPDASGASYFETAAALGSESVVTIQDLDLGPRGSLQGDTHFVSVLTSAGARVERLNNALRVHGPQSIKPIDFNLSDMPDTAMTAAVLACFASPTPDNPTATSTLRGLRTLRVKETDRLAALQTELSKLGAKVEILTDPNDESLRITPPSDPSWLHGSVASSLFFDTYNDHRMAMSLALIGLCRPNVHIRNPRCVAKTYPTFWQHLARLY